MKIKQIVVDEGVSEKTYISFVALLNKKGFGELDTLFVAKQHSGMPDGQIIHHLLSNETIFLTADRPLHNTILHQNLISYYTSEGNFTDKKLKGISTNVHVLHKTDLELKDNYKLPETAIRPYLLPSSKKHLKKLMTKRRRIRNHFGGQNHLEQVMITVSWQSFGPSSTIFGIKIRISSNIGIKALDASESYICDDVSITNRNVVALSYALIASVQLMLHNVKTILYYDSPKISSPLLSKEHNDVNPYNELFNQLVENFSDIEFVAASKGNLIERLRDKLKHLAKHKSNEVVLKNILDNKLLGK